MLQVVPLCYPASQRKTGMFRVRLHDIVLQACFSFFSQRFDAVLKLIYLLRFTSYLTPSKGSCNNESSSEKSASTFGLDKKRGISSPSSGNFSTTSSFMDSPVIDIHAHPNNDTFVLPASPRLTSFTSDFDAYALYTGPHHVVDIPLDAVPADISQEEEDDYKYIVRTSDIV